jgi:alpha-L-fucosidase
LTTANPTLLANAAHDQQAALAATMPDRLEHTARTQHPGAAWFPDASLGLFIHWGIASVHGGIDLSWSMIAGTVYDSAARGANKLTPNQYWQLADRFQPQNYDPRKWIKAARDAGFTYAVFTTMHHDGYTLWPTSYGDFGVQSHLGGRDLVKPFVDACREFGLQVGLYYSPPDWWFDRPYMTYHYRSTDPVGFPGRAHYDANHMPVDLPEMPETHIIERRRMFHGRIRELLTRYGTIDLLWLDGGAFDNAVRDLARRLQPGIVINTRSCDGDYDYTECGLPQTRFHGWFETCHCWQESTLPDPRGGMVDFWGYMDHEQYKPTSWMLDTLARLRTWGGNLLVNVGPRPDGDLPDIVYSRLAETAAWMSHSGKSLIGPHPGPYPELCNVPVTTAGGTLFLHALPGFAAPLKLKIPTRPRSVALLRTGEPLPHTLTAIGELTVAMPQALRTGLVDVVAVQMH